MKTALRTLAAALCFTAGARGASLSFVSASRSLEGGDTLLKPDTEFADFDARLVGLVIDPGAGGQREGCTASQQSLLRADRIRVVSEFTGDTGRGISLFHVTFHVDEAAAWSLTGSLNLLGTAGFACVTFQDLAHQDTTLINEVIFAPPQVSETRALSFGGTLEPGNYLLEAMIYGGGNNLSTTGSLNVVFSIPEPAMLLLACAILPALLRRR